MNSDERRCKGSGAGQGALHYGSMASGDVAAAGWLGSIVLL